MKRVTLGSANFRLFSCRNFKKHAIYPDIAKDLKEVRGFFLN